MAETQQVSSAPYISDEEWCEAIVANIGQSAEWNGIALPGYPSKETQSRTTFLGASESMMRGAFQLYKHVKDACAQHGSPIDSRTQILDFGCGWGRIARFFLKDMSLQNIHGVDVLSELTASCNETFCSNNFEQIEQKGTIPHATASFDVVFANSVFSHLDEQLNMRWINEIHRVLKPNGLAVLTVIDQKKYESMLNNNSEWMAKLGADTAETRDELYAGNLVWRTTNRQNELEGYGLTFIPVQWIRDKWGHLFDLKEVRDNYSQCVLVLTKKQALHGE
ncbi:hypothetical protein AB833_04095 [Chromatiales bacterium (ex Bugula neritina AB1)]|nr:hypothetical protein AB833_04095 [Chromatiales bacterium (ex Bugula neritina AB1)]